MPTANLLATLDSPGSVGQHASMTVGADSLGLISYYDETNGDLKVTHCSSPACSAATTATLDSAGVVGALTSVTVGADGLGLLSYSDFSNGDLKVTHCNDLACSSAITATVDGAGNDQVGLFTSVTVGVDGLGLISHDIEYHLTCGFVNRSAQGTGGPPPVGHRMVTRSLPQVSGTLRDGPDGTRRRPVRPGTAVSQYRRRSFRDGLGGAWSIFASETAASGDGDRTTTGAPGSALGCCEDSLTSSTVFLLSRCRSAAAGTRDELPSAAFPG